MNAFCPNFSNKQVKELFQELTNLVGENMSYYLWDKFEGSYDLALKEALSYASAISKASFNDSNPALWRINERILNVTEQWKKVTNKGIRHGKEIYLDETGYSSRTEAYSKIKELGIEEVSKVEENHGKYYIVKYTGKEYKTKIDSLYQHREYLSGILLLGSDYKSYLSDAGYVTRLFDDKMESSIGSMLTKLSKNNLNFIPILNILKKGLSTSVKGWKIKVVDFKVDPSIPWDVANEGNPAFFNANDNTIYIDLYGKFPGKGKADVTLLHEIVHAAAYHAVHNNDDLRDLLFDIFDNAVGLLEKKYGKTREQLYTENTSVFYGLTDPDEFLAEAWSNAAFIRELALLKSLKETKKSMLNDFVEWLLRIFGITDKNNSFVEANELLTEIILNHQLFNDSQEYKPDFDYAAFNSFLDESAILRQKSSKSIVKDLADKYKEIDSQIEFIEDTHTYINRKTGKIYKAVSDVKTEVGYGEQEDKLPQKAIELGNFTKVIGTKIHAILHDMLTGNFDIKNYSDIDSKVISQLQSITNDILKKYTVISSEQILVDDDLGIAGTADLIVQDKKTKKIILLDFKSKIRNLGENKKSGFSYYNSSKYGKPDSDKYNFLLSMYEKMHNKYGFSIDERGIIPIEYDANENGTITSVYISLNTKDSSLEDKGYVKIPHRSQIDLDINTKVYNNVDLNIDSIRIDRQNKILASILDTLKNKVVVLYSRGRTAQALDLEETVNEFNTLNEQEIIVSYIKTALNNLKTIIEGRNGYNEKLSQEKTSGATVWNLKQLENWREVAMSFKDLDELKTYLFDYQDIFGKEQLEILSILDEATRYRDVLEQAYKVKGKALWIEWITPFIKNIEGAYRLKAERQYKSEHKGNVDNNEMQAYIEKYVLDNMDKIQEETKQFIDKQSIYVDLDINTLYRYVDTIFQSKDPIISGMAAAYDQMQLRTNEEFNEQYKQLIKLTRELELKFGTSNFSDPRVVYDFMLENTSNGVYLIDKIPLNFIPEYNKACLEIDSNPEYDTLYKRFKAKQKWLNENAPIKDKKAYKEARIKALNEYLIDMNASQDEIDLILANENANYKQKQSFYELAKAGKISYSRADQLRKVVEEVTLLFRQFDPKKFPNKKWDDLQKIRESNPDDIRVRFFDFIVNLSTLGDSRVAPRYRLKGRLPGVSKTVIERISAGQSVGSSLKEHVMSGISLRADDTMYGQYDMTDESNRPINFVPVFYTNKMSVEDQSFDLPTIYKMWFKSALSYANTNEILDQLEYTRFVVNERQVRTGGVSYTSKIWKRLNPDSLISETWTVKDTNRLAEQLNDWFESVVYGKGTTNMGSFETMFGKIDAGKLINLLSKYTSLRVMGINVLSMVNNMAMAEVSQAIETMANKYVSPESYTKATAEYMLDLPRILGDVGARVPTSKTNLLNQLFGTFTEYSDGRVRLSNRFNRLFNSGALYLTTNIGEHEAQSRFLLASLINLRAIDKNGKDIGTIYDYYEVDEDGNLIFDKDNVVANWNDLKRREFSSKVRSQLMSMHGNYSDTWRVALQRNGYAKLALMFRKWIISTARKRFDSLYYDNIMQDYKEGYYRTGGRFLADNVKRFYFKFFNEARALELSATADWSNLTENEKANVKRLFTEIAITASLAILYALVANYEDKNDSILVDNILYQLYRLRTDLGFYYNPMDMFKIIQSPIPSTSTVKSIFNILNVFDWFDEYERGQFEGNYKITKYLIESIPVVRQLYRVQDIEGEFNILKLK